jgi:hypothetical protein
MPKELEVSVAAEAVADMAVRVVRAAIVMVL